MIAIILLSASVMTSIAYAQDVQQPDFKQENIMLLNEGDVINHDVFNVGDMSEIKGTVNGDVYSAGGNITVKGTVNGDVLAAGGTIHIAPGAIVTQDVRAAGGTVTIDGDIRGNITAAGGSIVLSDQAKVGGSFTAAAGDIRILTPITKNIKVATKTLYINGQVGGSAEVAVENITFGDTGKILGDLTYMSQNELLINESAVVGTTVHRLPPQELQKNNDEAARHIMGRAFAFIGLLGLIAKMFVGLLFIHLMPEFSKKAADNLRAQSWRSLGTGFLVAVLTPILIIALISTLIGAPLAMILFVGYILLMYISPVIVMLATGQYLAKRFNQKWNDAAAFIGGLLLLSLIRFVPVLNVISAMVIMFLGVGVLVNTKLEVYKELRKKNLI